MQPIVNDFFCGCGGMGVGFQPSELAGGGSLTKKHNYQHILLSTSE